MTFQCCYIFNAFILYIENVLVYEIFCLVKTIYSDSRVVKNFTNVVLVNLKAFIIFHYFNKLCIVALYRKVYVCFITD